MTTITAALIALAGVLIGALLSWLLGYFLEIHKARIQREHTRFTSYHTKQVEVLSEIYKQLSRIVPIINKMIAGIPSSAEDSLKDMPHYMVASEDTFKELKKVNSEYLDYWRGHSVYLDDSFELELEEVQTQIGNIILARISYSATPWENLPDDCKMPPFKDYLDKSVLKIKELMPQVKLRVKQLLQE